MAYKITKTATFNQDVTRLSSKIPRLDEFVVGLEKTLERKPEKGKATGEKYLYALTMDESAGSPSLTAYYLQTTDGEVVLLYLRTKGDAKPPPMIL
jgi:hypothetical protein